MQQISTSLGETVEFQSTQCLTLEIKIPYPQSLAGSAAFQAKELINAGVRSFKLISTALLAAKIKESNTIQLQPHPP